jgi:hypothetical protein
MRTSAEAVPRNYSVPIKLLLKSYSHKRSRGNWVILPDPVIDVVRIVKVIFIALVRFARFLN